MIAAAAVRHAQLATLSNPTSHVDHCTHMCSSIAGFGTCRGCGDSGVVLYIACSHGTNDRSGKPLTGDKEFKSHDACAKCINSDKHAANLRECQFCLDDKDKGLVDRRTPTGMPSVRLVQSGFQADMQPLLNAFKAGADKLAAGAAVDAVGVDVREGIRAAGNNLTGFLASMRDTMGYDGDVTGGQESVHAFTQWLTEQRRAAAEASDAPPAEAEAARLAEAERRGAARVKAAADKKAKADAKEQAKVLAAKEVKKVSKAKDAEIEKLKKTIAKKPKARAAQPTASQRRAASVPQRDRGMGERDAAGNLTGARSQTKKATEQSTALAAAAKNFQWFVDKYSLVPGKGGKPGVAMLPQVITLFGKLEERKAYYKTSSKSGDARTATAVAEFRAIDAAKYTDEKLVEMGLLSEDEEEEEDEEEDGEAMDEDEEEEESSGPGYPTEEAALAAAVASAANGADDDDEEANDEDIFN